MGLSFAAHKLEKFSSKHCKVRFEVLVHIFRYIRYNKILGLKYYDNINEASVFDLLRQDIIKTYNQLMDFSDSS